MKTEPWNRPARIADVRRDLWRHVSAAQDIEQSGLLALAAALLGWRPEDAPRLAAMQFVQSDEVRDLLRAAPTLIRTLTNSSSRYEEVSPEIPRGSVVWNKTISLRAARSDKQLWVTAPARRDYQTAENRMLTAMLDAVVELGNASESETMTTRAEARDVIRRRVTDADHVRQHRMLQQIDRLALTSREVARVRTGRARLRYEPVIEAYDRYEALVQRLDRTTLREVVEDAGLLAATNATLFRLSMLFGTIDVLEESGWTCRPLTFVDGVVQLRARSQDERRLTLHYRGTPSALMLGATAASAPDIVLRWTDPSGTIRWLLIDCRRGLDPIGVLAQQALERLLQHGRAFAPALAGQPRPYGLGVVWGSELTPDLTGEVALCTPDRLASALATIVR